jgi:hypothetical protein
VRGYEYAPDHYVILEDEELEQFRPARDKALVLEQFVPMGDIDPSFYAGRSLYLLPDGMAAQHPYGVVAEAMQQAGQGALGPQASPASRDKRSTSTSTTLASSNRATRPRSPTLTATTNSLA